MDIATRLRDPRDISRALSMADLAKWRAEQMALAADEIDALGDRISDLEENLIRIREWCDAYPVDIFTPPTKEAVKASVEAMKAPECASSEQMHGSWARHILSGVREFTDIVTKEGK